MSEHIAGENLVRPVRSTDRTATYRVAYAPLRPRSLIIYVSEALFASDLTGDGVLYLSWDRSPIGLIDYAEGLITLPDAAHVSALTIDYISAAQPESAAESTVETDRPEMPW